MNQITTKHWISAFLFLFIMLSNSHIAMSQDSRTTLSSEKKQLEKEIAAQKKLLESTKKNKTASIREIELIKNQLKKQERLIQTINNELLSLDHEIAENTGELQKLTTKLNLLIIEYKRAIYTAYKYRNTLSETSFILSANSLNQAAQRMNYLQEYSRSLNQQLKAILETQQRIKQKDELLNSQKKEKTSLIQDRNKEKEKLAKQQSEKNTVVANLKKQESKINAEIKKRQNRQKQIDAAIQRIIDAEIAKVRKAEEAKKTAKPTTSTSKTPTLTLTPEESALASDFESNKGKLPWPVEKGTITTNFGTYTHPEVSSVQITNNGINILTERNSPVRAVFKGKVAGIYDIEGAKVILIRHGNYISVYSNLSAVNVKAGEQVATKQQIGRMFNDPSNAYSELHFEIRKDKNPLNPSLWIKR